MKKPIVMIVDDDPEFGMRLKRSFAVAATWGSLFIDDLTEALRIIQSGQYDVRILLTDWHFQKGTSAELALYDGIALIESVQQADPNIECFLMTAQQSSPNFESRSMKIDKVRVMFKQDFDLGSTARIRETFEKHEYAAQQPWSVIASNVVYLSESFKPQEQESEMESDFETYIQDMPQGIIVKKPIPIFVHVGHDEGGLYFKASAPRLGLLVEAFGDDPLEAIEELKEVIGGHFIKLSEETELEGLAALSSQLMEAHLSRDAGGNGRQIYNYG